MFEAHAAPRRGTIRDVHRHWVLIIAFSAFGVLLQLLAGVGIGVAAGCVCLGWRSDRSELTILTRVLVAIVATIWGMWLLDAIGGSAIVLATLIAAALLVVCTRIPPAPAT